jgi:antitoxin component YwqK of YwqJK toxin-antitoxin module
LWHENGQKWEDNNYNNGRLHGKSLGWSKDGEKQWEVEYQNGQLYYEYIT